jgi:hypothetical protein
MKRIVWQRSDGSIEISTPAAPMLKGETEDQYLDRVAARIRVKRVAAGLMSEDTVEAGRISPADFAALDRAAHASWRWDDGRKCIVVSHTSESLEGTC